MRHLAFALASFALGACGLGLVGVGVDSEAVGVPPEAAPSADAPELPPPRAEGGALVDADAGAGDASIACETLLDVRFTTDPSTADWAEVSTSGWQSNGGGEVVLTARGDNNAVGALWHRHALEFSGSLRVSVDFAVDRSSDEGDGISVVWSATNDFPVGSAGLSLGFCGQANLTALAAQYRYASGRIDAVRGTENDGECATDNTPALRPVTDTATLDLILTATSVTAQIGELRDNPASATVPKVGYLGVTASTGGQTRSGTAVRAIRVRACP